MIYKVILLASVIGVCLGSGGGGGSSGHVLEGRGPVSTGNTVILKSGNPLWLQCTNDTSTTETEWKRDDKVLVSGDYLQIFKNGSLHIAEPKDEDIANYTCSSALTETPITIHVISLKLERSLTGSYTFLENDKLRLSCGVSGNPMPQIQWLKDGSLMVLNESNSRIKFNDNNEYKVENAILHIEPVLKEDAGSYACRVSSYDVEFTEETTVNVKDIYAALWPFLGTIVEVTILCVLIFIYEKRRIRKNVDLEEDDNANDQKVMSEKDGDIRQRSK